MPQRYWTSGRLAEARPIVSEIMPLISSYGLHGYVVNLALHADRIPDDAGFVSALEGAPGHALRWRRAAIHAAAGEHASAADVLAEMDFVSLEAYARLRGGEQLAASRQYADAARELEKALAFYRGVDASRFADRAAAALSSAQSESA